MRPWGAPARGIFSGLLRLLGCVEILICGFGSPHAFALEKCWFERHRSVDPPGSVLERVHVGMTDQAQRLTDSNSFFDYLKKADGKICDVDWKGAKLEIDEWFVKLNHETFQHEDDLEQILASSPLSALPTTSTAQGPDHGDCESKWKVIRSALAGLKSADFDDSAKRASRLEMIQDLLDYFKKRGCF